MTHFNPIQRARIQEAAQYVRDMEVDLGEGYDVVDLASETGNYFWSGLSDRQARAACRYLYLVSASIVSASASRAN